VDIAQIDQIEEDIVVLVVQKEDTDLVEK